MSRALGDFWSWSEARQLYMVSPEPTVTVHRLEADDQFLVLATDGLWDMLKPQAVVSSVLEVGVVLFV